MSPLAKAQSFCFDNDLPDTDGWVLFYLSDDLDESAVPFAWAATLPNCFQPFRVGAIHLGTDEIVKSRGLGGRQRWEGVK